MPPIILSTKRKAKKKRKREKMAKTFEVAVLVATALCFASLLGFAHCHEQHFVQGRVYCDTCRVQFETKITEYMSGAKVKLQCRDRAVGPLNVTYSVEGETDETGTYHLAIEGDHEEEICEVIALKSGRADCEEGMQGRDRARVLITSNNGIPSEARYANPLGFMKKKAHPECEQVLREMGFVPLV